MRYGVLLLVYLWTLISEPCTRSPTCLTGVSDSHLPHGLKKTHPCYTSSGAHLPSTCVGGAPPTPYFSPWPTFHWYLGSTSKCNVLPYKLCLPRRKVSGDVSGALTKGPYNTYIVVSVPSALKSNTTSQPPVWDNTKLIIATCWTEPVRWQRRVD